MHHVYIENHASISLSRPIDQCRPLNSSSHLDQALAGVKVQDSIHFDGVQQHSVDAELLAAYCVPPACDGNIFSGSSSFR